MKKTIRIKESQLNDVIRKVIKEQQEMTTGPNPAEMTGAPEDETPAEGEGPNFEEFKTCAKTLLDQGVTIGNLVDQLIEAQNAEPETEEQPEPDTEGGVEPEAPMNESKKVKSKK